MTWVRSVRESEFVQAQNIELDDDGCAWSAWSVTRAWQNSPGPDSKRLCKYDPKQGKIIYFKTGLPKPGSRTGLRTSMFDSMGYSISVQAICLQPAGTARSIGSMRVREMRPTYQLRSKTGRVVYLPMKLGPDGWAYGVTGMEGKCEVIRFDPKTEKYDLLGSVSDGEDKCWQIHDIAVSPDGAIYACENDNPMRSSYLWEIIL